VLYDFARPLLFTLDPEAAHTAAFKALERAHRLGLARVLTRGVASDPVHVMGLAFDNPVGLAAGLDKNAAHIDALFDLGFGFVEVGTVTPLPQPGNPRPRLFRLTQAKALINRFGFNNDGIDEFVARVTASTWAHRTGRVVGLNLGKNAATPIEQALTDYQLGLRAVYPLLVERPGYVTVNISSPNTKDLRTLQKGSGLEQLLAGLREERLRLAEQHAHRVPMAVKVAPDLADDDLRRIADAFVDTGIDAVIATNTTTSREAVAGLPNSNESGGLSGAPLRERATEVVALLHEHLGNALPIIGVGGIMSGQDATEKLRAGASLVQLYTGLIYRGPTLVTECRRAILQLRTSMDAGLCPAPSKP
jgi:dihydroorotate dehydrogenase